MTEWLVGLPTHNEALLYKALKSTKPMKRNETSVQRLQEEFAKFQSNMQEMHLLRHVANDLKNYRRMIKLKRYD